MIIYLTCSDHLTHASPNSISSLSSSLFALNNTLNLLTTSMPTHVLTTTFPIVVFNIPLSLAQDPLENKHINMPIIPTILAAYEGWRTTEYGPVVISW